MRSTALRLILYKQERRRSCTVEMIIGRLHFVLKSRAEVFFTAEMIRLNQQLDEEIPRTAVAVFKEKLMLV